MAAVVLRGDARNLPLPDNSVDLICTSPPYWGLRSYTDGGDHYDGQIGDEATPAEYIDSLLACTAEWARVLKPSGSMFVVLGDVYSSRADGSAGRTWRSDRADALPARRNTTAFARRKSLLGLPQRYWLGCIDELDLIVRAEIPWWKSNPMPESVEDRVRREHETILHLVKQPNYFEAIDEIRLPHTEASIKRAAPHRTAPGRAHREGLPTSGTGMPAHTLRGGQMNHPLGRLMGSVWHIATTPFVPPPHIKVKHHAAFPVEVPRRCILGWSPVGICTACGEGRHPVSVPTGDHGRRPGGGGTYRDMRAAGAKDTNLADAALRPRTIVGYACACTPYTDHEGSGEHLPRRDYGDPAGLGQFANPGGGLANKPLTGPWREHHFDRWQAAPTRPAVVLDPFGGTGTTALVADVLGRTGISADRSLDYCRLAQWRTTDPTERAKALGVPKPPPVSDGQLDLFAS